MIYCVWYPSGGFGHFVTAVLNLHGKNFVRPKRNLEFSSNGNSHSLDYVAPSFYKNQTSYSFDFDPTLNYAVIVDTGIDHEQSEFVKFFPGATVIKMCYSDFSWPIVANTMITKAMLSSLDQQLDHSTWNTDQDWARREKYFLFLRDHALRHAWKPDSRYSNIQVEQLLNYHDMVHQLTQHGVEPTPFEQLHAEWYANNEKYFKPVLDAQKFMQGQMNTAITDVWTQAIVYYQIWCQHGIEVPHNDFANFFTYQQYQDWLGTAL